MGKPAIWALLGFACFALFGAGATARQENPNAKSETAGASQSAAVRKMDESTDRVDSEIHTRGWRYTVHPSDTLELTFLLTPEFDQTVTVQPDGYIALRDAGEVLVAGKTLWELTGLIKGAYDKVLHDPVISVDAKDFEKPYVLVGGQVGKPGKFDWRGQLTLVQAITIAGGFTDNAKHSQVLLFRRVSEEWAEAKLINVKQMLRGGNLQEDVELQPGDMIYVPKNVISKIKPYIPIPTLGLYSNQF